MNRERYENPAKRATSVAPSRRDAGFLAHDFLIADLRGARRYARGRFLDLGCGNQPYRALFEPLVDCYLGLDHDPAGSRPDVVGAASAVPIRGASIDTVLATQVLEHVPEPSRVLEEASRVLASGGHLILTAPQYWRLHEEPHDYFRFTRFGLEHLVRASGLEMIEIREQGGVWTVVGLAFANALQRRRRWRRLIPITNSLFAWLDRVWRDQGDTANYFLVARRRVRP